MADRTVSSMLELDHMVEKPGQGVEPTLAPRPQRQRSATAALRSSIPDSRAAAEASVNRCRLAFSQFDKAGNGVIRWAELVRAPSPPNSVASTACPRFRVGLSASARRHSLTWRCAAQHAALDDLGKFQLKQEQVTADGGAGLSTAESTELCNALLKEADLARDGLISFEEFVQVNEPRSRRRDCHFTDIPSPSISKRLLKEEGGAAE